MVDMFIIVAFNKKEMVLKYTLAIIHHSQFCPRISVLKAKGKRLKDAIVIHVYRMFQNVNVNINIQSALENYGFTLLYSHLCTNCTSKLLPYAAKETTAPPYYKTCLKSIKNMYVCLKLWLALDLSICYH